MEDKILSRGTVKAAVKLIARTGGSDLKSWDSVLDSHEALRASLAEAQQDVERLRKSDLGLRKKVHAIDRHNQLFPRCESAWCHPEFRPLTVAGDPQPDPALEFALDTAIMDQCIATDWEQTIATIQRLTAELATERETSRDQLRAIYDTVEEMPAILEIRGKLLKLATPGRRSRFYCLTLNCCWTLSGRIRRT